MSNTEKNNSAYGLQDTEMEKESVDIQRKAKLIIDGIYSGSIDTSIVQKSVEDALSGNTQQAIRLMKKGDFELFHHLPSSMKEDSDIALTAIKMHPHIFESLSLKLKNSPEIKKQALLSGVLASQSIITLISIVESDKKTQKSMRKFLMAQIEKKEDFPSDVWSKLLLQIYEKNADIYKIITGKGLLESHQSGICLGSRFTVYLSKQADNLEAHSIEQSKEILLTQIQQFLEIAHIGKYPILSELCENIVASINIVELSDQEEDDDTSTASSEIIEESDSIQDEYQYHGPYRVSQTNNNCTVWDTQGKNIVIDQSTYKSMSETSLINYMNFSIKMHDLGLGFLLEKHLHKIQIATGMNFFQGEGMSGAKILIFLNKIGKRLRVPESSYEDADGNRKTLCFNDLSSAYLRFREIASSGKVSHYNFDIANRGSNTIVELYMKSEGIVNTNSGDLSIVGFQESNV